MRSEHKIVKQVYAAKESLDSADELIRNYIPFIKSETSKVLMRICDEQDDEFSIAMIAFHEAIRGYEESRGAFLSYAAMLIRSRLTDYHRKESRHSNNLSLFDDEGETSEIIDSIEDNSNPVEESINLEATKQEIEELSFVMNKFGVSFSDVSENSPKQERTMEACKRVICYAIENKHLLDELLNTKKLPMAQLVTGSGVERKTIERHRKYILVMLLIQTNGYEIIRGHLRYALKMKGGSSK